MIKKRDIVPFLFYNFIDSTKAASSRRIFYITGTFIGFHFYTDFLDSSTISQAPDLLKNSFLSPSKTITHWNRIFGFFYANPDFYILFMQINLLFVVEIDNSTCGRPTKIESIRMLDRFKCRFFDHTFQCYF